MPSRDPRRALGAHLEPWGRPGASEGGPRGQRVELYIRALLGASEGSFEGLLGPLGVALERRREGPLGGPERAPWPQEGPAAPRWRAPMGPRAPFSPLPPRLRGPPPPRPLPRRPQVHMVRMCAAAEQGARARPRGVAHFWPLSGSRRGRGAQIRPRAAAVLARCSPASWARFAQFFFARIPAPKMARLAR